MKFFAFYTEECWIRGIRTSLVNAIFFKLADELVLICMPTFLSPLKRLLIFILPTLVITQPVTATRS